MGPIRRAAIIGAALAVGYLTWTSGPATLSHVLKALLEPVIYLVYAFIAALGAFAAVSVVLAWQHVRESPRWLLGTLAGLLLVSMSVVRPFVQEMRYAQRFLSTADSTRGVVANKYVRGGIHLVVDYEVAGQTHRITRSGANPYLGTPAFTEWETGDSIRVYYQPAKPEEVMIGHPGPDRRILIESLLKECAVWGILLTAYLPLIVRRVRRRPVVSATPMHQYQT